MYSMLYLGLRIAVYIAQYKGGASTHSVYIVHPANRICLWFTLNIHSLGVYSVLSRYITFILLL